jgi:hypothetical protein
VVSPIAFRECIREVADQLGLTFLEILTPTAFGSIRGHPVCVCLANEAERVVTEITLRLSPRLDLFVGHDSNWDSPNAHPYHQARARELLGGSVSTTLNELGRAGLVKPADDELRFIDRRDPTPQSIVSAIELLVQAADTIDARRPQVAVRTELLRLTDAFDALAKELGLEVIRSPLGAVGRINEVAVRAFMFANAGDWHLKLEAEYPHAPGIHVALRPNGSTWPQRVVQRLRGRSHVVWSNNVEELRNRLDRVTLEDLGRLVNEGEFSVEATGLHLVRRSCDYMTSVLGKMARTAGVIAGAHRGGGGPFRE